ncbi:MAG: Sir2 family NAD-dependent protein deacetylase [Microbacteriaceae bacterium]
MTAIDGVATVSAASPTGHSGLLDRAADSISGRRIAVLTGAGVSTDSGIPDYRGEGARPSAPMTYQQFMSDERYRKRYWAGSHLGWRRFDAAVPNVGHYAIAELERTGRSNGVITQNVDDLHLRAGSQRVVDLHGTMNLVRCLRCGQGFARRAVAERISAENGWIDAIAQPLRPDGDADPIGVDAFVVPDCSICGGVLKPNVVFFGEYVPREKFMEAAALIQSAEALLIAGSSLVVNSGLRLLDQASKRRVPIVIINRGATKGDRRATVKLDAGTSETLAALVARLS